MTTLMRTVPTFLSLWAVTLRTLLVILRQEMQYHSVLKTVTLHEFASIQSCVAQLDLATNVSSELEKIVDLVDCNNVETYLPLFLHISSDQCIMASDFSEYTSFNLKPIIIYNIADHYFFIPPHIYRDLVCLR